MVQKRINLNSRLEAIRAEFNQPIPSHKESTMTDENTSETEQEENSRPAKVKKSSSERKKEKKTKSSSKKIEEVVTLADLAEESDLTPAKIRQKLRAASIEKPQDSTRWAWPPKSKTLKQIRKLLASK